MRTLGIWVFGVLASMIVGGMIGAQLDTLNVISLGGNLYINKALDSGQNAILGMFAGAFAFACVRLWLTGK